MSLELAAHIIIDTLNLAIGGYVLAKDPRGIVHRSFFIFVLGIAAWSASMMLLAFTGWVWLLTVPFFGAELMVLGFVFLAEFFPDGGTLRRPFLVSIVPWLAVTLLTPSDLIVHTAVLTSSSYLKPEHGPLFPLFGVVMGGYILWGIVKLSRKYRRLQGVRRVQMRYFAAGAGIFLALAFLTNIVLPLFRLFEFNLLGPLFSVIFVGTTAYAIVRHQFMDIRVVIQRGILYVLSIGLLACVFFGIDFVVRQFTEVEGWSDDVIAAIVGAFGFIWFRRFFERITDPIFFRNDYRYEAAVRELGVLLHSTIDLAALLRALDGFLAHTIKPERTVFIIDRPGEKRLVHVFIHGPRGGEGTASERERYGEKADALAPGVHEPMFSQGGDDAIAAIVPLVAREGSMATMLLGKKRSDDIFRLKDMELLSVIAHQAGMAIENAWLYEAERRHGEELEERVRERTEKIQRMQEAQAKFLTDVSHELQTPMAVFGCNMEILEGKRKGNKKAALGVMAETLARMSGMIGHLLAAARLNFSKEKLHKEEILVENLLEEAYHDCCILAEDKGILLSYASEPVRIAGDRERLKEVVLNLISNALKHTMRGGRIVLRGTRAGECAEVSVEDTGSGIAPEDLTHIFDRFYRIRADDSPGTGLGLDICKKIVEMHGGSIRAESELGKGSRFVVTLPALPRV